MPLPWRGRALVALAVVAAARAQDKPLELQDLINEALRDNQEILAAQKRYEAARQRPRQQSSLPDPTLSLGYWSNGNPLPGAGLGKEPTSNIGFSFTQDFPYPGKRRLQGEISSKDADAELEQYHAVQRSVILRLSEAYYRLHHTYPAMEVLERNHALVETLLRTIEVRYGIGKATQQEAFRTQTQLTILETQRLQIENDRRTRQAEINSILNRALDTQLPQPADHEMEEMHHSLEELEESARLTAPELRRDQKLLERSELALNLAHQDSYPDYAITGGYFNMGGLPAMYQFRADVKLPLQFSRRRAEVTEQAQKIAQARHEYTAATQSINYRIEEALLAAETAYKLATLYRQTAIPQAQLTLQSSLTGFQNGAADFTSVFMNHIAALEYEMSYHEQMLNHQLATAQIEALTGLKLQ
jgi:cobalt-zinc-cadmium efflux system outer membrane protein